MLAIFVSLLIWLAQSSRQQRCNQDIGTARHGHEAVGTSASIAHIRYAVGAPTDRMRIRSTMHRE